MSCYKPNINNPMGNFLPFDDRKREPTCIVPARENLDNLVKYSDIVDDSFKYHFNPQPVTNSYPDTTAFAKFLFPDPARCRDTGYLCRTNADSTLNLDRLAYLPKDKYYQEINSKNTNQFKIGGHTN
jgi:hypothetical protein